ncbi:helix-turn-helix domain-containing protein [Clostridium sp. YIM B02506]
MYDSKEYSISEITKATDISKTSLYKYTEKRINEKDV